MTDFITNLPSSLACGVLSTWLEIQSLVRLDSAYCKSDKRGCLHDLLRSKECISSELVILNNTQLLQWIFNRNIQVSRICLQGGIDVFVSSQYLLRFGEWIRTVHLFEGCTIDDAYRVVAYCRNLRSVQFDEKLVTTAFIELLNANPQLDEVFMYTFDSAFTATLDKYKCPSLKHLQVKDCLEGPLPWKTFTGFALEEIVLGNLPWFSVEDATIIAEHCPMLRQLSADDMNVCDRQLNIFATSCKQLTYMSILNNTVVTDKGILQLIKGLPLLTCLHIGGCTKLTAQSLKYIRAHAAALVVLSVDIPRNGLSELTTLVKERAHITCLELRSVAQDTTAAEAAFAQMGHIRSLVLEGELVTDAVLCWVAQYCPKLERLSLLDEVVSLKKSPLALAKGCPLLKLFVVGSLKYVGVSALPFLQYLRPQLRVVTYDSSDTDKDAFFLPI